MHIFVFSNLTLMQTAVGCTKCITDVAAIANKIYNDCFIFSKICKILFRTKNKQKIQSNNPTIFVTPNLIHQNPYLNYIQFL